VNRKIHVPSIYGHYTFKVKKNGYISHVQHFRKADLAVFDELAFELIPSSLEGFKRYGSNENQLIAYFPNDRNRCKLYARVDVPEGMAIEYVWADRSASTPSGFPLAESVYTECFDEVTQCYSRVNLFGNTPYTAAINFCDDIDLEASNESDALHKTVITSYLFMDPPFTDHYWTSGPFETAEEIE
jgi:hypothetical protein